jgi:hypothetical protein
MPAVAGDRDLLVAFFQRNGVGPEEPIFRNRYGQPLRAAGARFRLKKYVQSAHKKFLD